MISFLKLSDEMRVQQKATELFFSTVATSYIFPTHGARLPFFGLYGVRDQTKRAAFSIQHVDITQRAKAVDLFHNPLR